MKKVIGSLVAVAGFAAAAHAQPAVGTMLTYQARVFNAGNDLGWVSNLAANPGDRIEVRALVSYIGTGTVGGLGQCVFQPVVTNWTASDALVTDGPNMQVGPIGGTRSTPIGTVADAPGAYGRITPWGANATTTTSFLRGHLGTGTAAGMLRIAQAQVTNWIGVGPTSGTAQSNNATGGGGVSVAQIANPARLATDPPFNNGSSNLVVFKFSFTLSGSTADRTLNISTPQNGFGRTTQSGQLFHNIRWFANESEASASVQTAAIVTDANVRIVPAPGAMALMGLGGLLAARRRR